MNRVQAFTRAVRRHRALLAAGLLAGAVATALPVVAPPPTSTVEVVAASRDLRPGAPLSAADLTTVRLPTSVAPSGAITSASDVVGRAVAGQVRRGEALTDVRLVGSGLLGAARGLVAAPVRLADPATAGLLRSGDRVDVLATSTEATAQARDAVLVAAGLQVLAIPEAGQADPDGALVVLAATPETAARLAGSAVGSRLSVTVLAP